jgi:hypothetical protein
MSDTQSAANNYWRDTAPVPRTHTLELFGEVVARKPPGRSWAIDWEAVERHAGMLTASLDSRIVQCLLAAHRDGWVAASQQCPGCAHCMAGAPVSADDPPTQITSPEQTQNGGFLQRLQLLASKVW